MFAHNAWLVMLAMFLTIAILAGVWCYFIDRQDRLCPRDQCGQPLKGKPGFFWEGYDG